MTLVKGTVAVWDSESGKSVTSIQAGHAGAAALRPDGQQVATTGAEKDRGILLYDVPGGKEIRGFGSLSGPVVSMRFSPDGKTIAAGTHDSIVYLFSADSGETRFMLTGHKGMVMHVAFSPDGKTLASAAQDGKIILWNVTEGLELRSFAAGTSWMNELAFMPDGKTLLGTQGARNIGIWSVSDGKLIKSILIEEAATCLCVSPDGKTAAWAGKDSEIFIWEPLR
jgi:WD40 repeat protein